MSIKHLVLCGGGPVGLISYGVLKELSNKKILKLDELKSIYATSIGSIIGLIYLLNIEWSWIDDFIIKRPWENLLNFSSADYLNLMYLKDTIASFEHQGDIFNGTIRGISDDGSLIIEKGDKTYNTFKFKEIKYIF